MLQIKRKDKNDRKEECKTWGEEKVIKFFSVN